MKGDKVYVVIGSGKLSDDSWIVAVFSSREDAERNATHLNDLGENSDYYVDEELVL